MAGNKSMKPGMGGRFSALVSKLEGKGKTEEAAEGIAAAVGRKKYGPKKMAGWAKAGRKRAGKDKK